MKKYNVTVNGNLYQVEVDEVKGDFVAPVTAPVATKAPVITPTPIAATPVTPVTAAPAVASSPVSSNTTGEKIIAPMPGTIVKVVAAKGAAVKKGDVIVVLEAMKMENEIMAPTDGIVIDIVVSQGAAVNNGDLLAIIG